MRSKFDAIESQSLRATSESLCIFITISNYAVMMILYCFVIVKDMITAQRNGIVEESAYRREQELKIEHLAKELALVSK